MAAADSKLRPQAFCPSPGPTTSTEAWPNSPINWLADEAPTTMASGKRANAAGTCSLRVATETSPAPLRKALWALSRIAPPNPRSPPINST
ncbi:hypothetical protein D3C80_1908630 [compost metagenome]